MYREKDKKKTKRILKFETKINRLIRLEFFFYFLKTFNFQMFFHRRPTEKLKTKAIEMIRKGKNGTQFNKQQVQYLLYIHTNIETRFRLKIKPKQLTLLSELLQDRGGQFK